MQIKAFQPDESASKGVWIDFDKEKGVAFLIAYSGTNKFEEKKSRLSFRARQKGGRHNKQLPPEMKIEVNVDAMVGDVLMDWRGLDDGYQEDGSPKPFPFTPKNARALLLASSEIRNFIIVESMDLTNFKEPEEEVIDGEEGEDSVKESLKSEPKLVPEVRQGTAVSA